MKLTLSQQELEQAVRSYVNGMINLQPGTDITIDFKAGRGDNGITAEVDISYLAVTSIPAIQASVQKSTVDSTGATATLVNAKDEEPAAAKSETRKTAGKTMFGSVKEPAVESATTGTAANDAATDPETKAEETPAAVATGGRKTLFSQ